MIVIEDASRRRTAAHRFGTCVLRDSLWYLEREAGEHRADIHTPSQACKTINITSGIIRSIIVHVCIINNIIRGRIFVPWRAFFGHC